MDDLNYRQIGILEKIPIDKGVSSSWIYKNLTEKASLVTVKRDLDYLVDLNYLSRDGKSRSTVYRKTILGLIFLPVDAHKYNKVDPDLRDGRGTFNFEIFDNFPLDIFSESEYEKLDNATKSFQEKLKGITPVVETKELERFVIELSWKSSKIEGNTYTLLDTEKLIKEGIPAKGHTKEETAMVLNHKKAFTFILENLSMINEKGLTLNLIEKVHELLTLELGVAKGFRNGLVGIVGTKYKPLDNKYQITEAMNSLCNIVNKMDSIYSKALSILVGISYIQPFEDGNKRTSRLLCNALLLAGECAPLSYRSVEENDYRESILVFYEKNSVIPMKRIFIEQYIFSTENYLIKKSNSV